MRVHQFFCFLMLCVFSCVCPASLHFTLTCADPEIAVGDETTLIISAYDDQAPAGYGLVEWQFDLWLGAGDDGVLDVVSTAVYEEGLYANAFYGPTSVDNPTTGSVNSFGAFQVAADPASNLGVGGFTPIASVTVKGLTAGMVTYTLGSLTSPDNFYGRVRDAANPVTAMFDAAGSVVAYRVVPEPASLLLLSGLCGLGVLGRKRA